MRLLVIGAAGMLGRDVIRAAEAAGHDVTALARPELDITDAVAVGQAVAAARPGAVVNCAAWTDVDGAEAGEAAATRVNGDGAGHVAAAAREAGAHLVHVSTDYVFAGDATEPYVESSATGPLSAYGRSKLAGEHAVLAAAGPDGAGIVRASWLFGAGGPNFAATMLRLARERDELKVVDDQVGFPTYTADLAAGLLRIAEARTAGILHAGGDEPCTWYAFARAVLAAAGEETVVHPCTTAEFPRPAPRPAYSVLGTERTDAPRLRPWRDGLHAYLDELRVRP